MLLDEAQLLGEFEAILNSLSRMKNVDVYVTGSNAKFLSKDIITEFRGRGDEIHMFPLTFREFMSAYPGDKETGWKEYVLFDKGSKGHMWVIFDPKKDDMILINEILDYLKIDS